MENNIKISQKHEASISQSRNSFLPKRTKRKRMQQVNQEFKTMPKIIIPETQNKMMFHKEGVNNGQKQDDLSAYRNIQTIRKVATFLQNMKKYVVKQIPRLGKVQSLYLQIQTEQQKKDVLLISWDNPLLISFQVAFLIVIFGAIWLSTYQFVFEKIQQALPIRIITLFFYTISIILTLNTERKTEKLQVVNRRTQIAWIFIKEDLLLQACAFISTLLQIIGTQALFYPERILFLASFYTALRIMKKIEDNFAVSNQIESVIGIIKLSIKIFTFLHFFSLILNGMGRIQNSPNTWIKQNGFSDQSPFQMYVTGFYWATTIMSTVGFGDITPANVLERGLMSFMMVFCCLFFGYCVNFIGTMIGVLGQSKAIYEKDIRRLNKYLNNTKIPNNVKSKIKQHFYNEYQIQQVYDKESQQYLFNKMTQSLRAEVTQNNSIKVVQKSKFLSFFSESTKNKIARQLVRKVYAPQKTIFDKDTENSKLFLIQDGQINQFCFNLKNSHLMEKKMIAKYNKQDNTIGWGNLITGYKYKSCTKSQNYTLLYQMDQRQFIQILKQNRNDFIKFHEIRERILQKQISFKKECFVCEKLTHNVISCPNIHFIPKPAGILISFNSRQLNKRYHKRNRKIKRGILRQQLIYQQFPEFYQNDSLNTAQVHSYSIGKQPQFLQKDILLAKNASSNIRQSKGSSVEFNQFRTILKRNKMNLNFQTIEEERNSLAKQNQRQNGQKSGPGQRSKKNNIFIDKFMFQADSNFFPLFQASQIFKKLQSQRLQRCAMSKVMNQSCRSRFKIATQMIDINFRKIEQKS